jgi:hypothetical protein
MAFNGIGAFLIGTIVGWLLVFTMRKQGMDWKVFGEVAVLIVGGSQLTMITERDLVGPFWIGIFAGFVANIIVNRFAKNVQITTMR